jgi:hypothetical protein
MAEEIKTKEVERFDLLTEEGQLEAYFFVKYGPKMPEWQKDAIAKHAREALMEISNRNDELKAKEKTNER